MMNKKGKSPTPVEFALPWRDRINKPMTKSLFQIIGSTIKINLGKEPDRDHGEMRRRPLL